MINIIPPPEIHEDEKEFSYLKTLIKKKIGFNCEDYKQPHLKRRLAVRLRVTNSRTYKEYAEILQREENEAQKLKDTLTVNVTEFFRNPEIYEVLSKKCLPTLLKAKGENKTLRIWSAGCSNGDEPYSIAIALREYLGILIKKYNISITGTDIDEDSLEKARNGTYPEKSLEKLSKERISRYFTKVDNGYQVNDDIRSLVNFKRHDMISGAPMSGFDFVFCRNVTIYFDKPLQEKLYLNFYNALNNNGFFVMGKTETLIGPASKLFESFEPREKIYQKRR